MIKVSVVIPVFNTESYLEQCIQSVLNQTYNNLEIILINDGSTDASGKICEDYSGIDNRIVYIETENKGQGFARNLGIKKSTGDYIVFMDSDDYLDLDTIERYLSYAEGESADIYGFNYYIYDENLGKDICCIEHDVVYNNAVSICQNKECLGQMSPVLCVKLIRRSLITEADILMENYMCEDLLFLAQLYAASEKVMQVPYAGYHYRYNRNGNMSTNGSRYNEVIIVTEKLINAFIKKGVFFEYWRELYQLTFNIYKDFLFRLNGKRNMLQKFDAKIYEQYKREYYDSLEQLFGKYIDTSILNKKFLVIGSYNLRTIVHTLLLDETQLIGDYSASAIESIMCCGNGNQLLDELCLAGDNKYRKRQVVQDVTGAFLKTDIVNQADIIIIDLLEEVNPLIDIEDMYVTISDYIPDYYMYEIKSCLSFLDDNRDSIFYQAAKKFADILNNSESEVVVIENYYCAEHTTYYDEKTKFVNANTIHLINKKLKVYYEYLESLLHNARVIKDKEFYKYRFTSNEWPFGCRPYYYNNTYCRNMAIEICKREPIDEL